MRFSKLDETNYHEHHHIRLDDTCLYMHEYTPGRGYSFSTANQLIANLKKKPSNHTRPDYHYKTKAIRECSMLFSNGLNSEWLEGAVLVPVPGSKSADHPDYDTRMEDVCRGIGETVDVRPLVTQTVSTSAAHEGERISLDELLAIYEINEGLLDDVPLRIGVVDDVLTAGTHFRAMHTTLINRLPNASIVGIFVARVVRPNPFDEF